MLYIWGFVHISSLSTLTVVLRGSGKRPPNRTACSQVQSYQGLQRTAMFEHPNPQPSFFPNFNSCRCCHFSPTTTGSAMFCTQTQRGPGRRGAFVRPSKGSRTCSMIRRCFDPSLWRVLPRHNPPTVPKLWTLNRTLVRACIQNDCSPFCSNLHINPKRKGQGSCPISITESVDLLNELKDTLRKSKQCLFAASWQALSIPFLKKGHALRKWLLLDKQKKQTVNFSVLSVQTQAMTFNCISFVLFMPIFLFAWHTLRCYVHYCSLTLTGKMCWMSRSFSKEGWCNVCKTL